MPNDITPAHCQLTNHHVLGEDRQAYRQEDDTWGDTYEMLKCCGCETITMRNVVIDHDGVHIITYYPPAVVRRAPDWLRSDVGRIELIVDGTVIGASEPSDGD